ncbi:MAG: hypothetical protein ACFFBD_25305 [Candidatus Hodarchaeota archaeon]
MQSNEIVTMKQLFECLLSTHKLPRLKVGQELQILNLVFARKGQALYSVARYNWNLNPSSSSPNLIFSFEEIDDTWRVTECATPFERHLLRVNSKALNPLDCLFAEVSVNNQWVRQLLSLGILNPNHSVIVRDSNDDE